jgi:hypothetical protein
MIVIRGPDEVSRIVDSDMRRLVDRRFAEVCNGEPYDVDVHGEMIVVEPGDTLASLERESGVPIASNPFDDCRYPDPEFVPASEYIGVHSHCYEIVILFSDDGAGVNFFIPKSPGIDVELLALCAKFAEPAFDPAAR